MTVYYLVIPAVIIFFLFLPVVIEFKASYNILSNTGVISLYLFKKNIIYYIFEFHGNSICLKNEDEIIEKNFEFDSPELDFVKYFVKEIINKIRLRFLNIYYNIGLNDAFLTSMVCGYVNTICHFLFAQIKNKKPTASLGLYDTQKYNGEEAVLIINGNLSLSLFEFVYSLLFSVILTKKLKNKTLIKGEGKS